MRTVLSAIIVSLSLMLFLSCGSVIDFGNLVNGKSLTNKTIGFISPSANDFAAGLVPVEAVLNGLTIDELSRVELFIGGSLKATYTLPPFTYSWDTSALSDGPVEIKIKATLKNTKVLEASVIVNVQQGIFVSTSGSDFNPGTKTLPLKTIQVAVDKAFAQGVKGIYVEKGTYTPGNGLNASGCGFSISNQNINLIGGYDPDFNSRPGMSDLKGNSALLHVIYISNMINGVIDGFIIREGIANGGGYDAYGGGLDLSSSSNVKVTNMVLMNNNGTYAAGAMLYSCVDSSFSLLVTNNTSSSGGGGVYLTSCTNSVLFGDISYNRTSGGPQGGLEIYLCSNATVSAVFSNNQVATSGSGISIDSSTGVFLNNCVVVNGTSGNFGGGLYVNNSTNINISGCSFISNSSGVFGGGIHVDTSTVNISGSHIDKNITLGTYGAGIYINNSKCSVTGSTVNGNTGNSADGGGFFINAYSFIDLISCDISGNTALYSGGIFSYLPYSLNVINCSLTNDSGSTGGINAVIVFQYAASQTNTVISNCIIGGTNNSSTYGIYEHTGNMILQYIMNNTFLTNCLGNLYYDFGGAHIVINSPTDWVMINNNLYSGAAVATGNTVAVQ